MTFRILAFDTSTEVCSVALMVDGHVNESFSLIPYQHEKKILLMIDRLLLDADITLESLDCLVFCRGPGSFVGIRIGMSLAQGLALGANLPLIGLSSLKILAQGVLRLIKAKKVLTTINARLGELYFACYSYQSNDNIWLGGDAELVVTPDDMVVLISKLDGEWVLVGTGWKQYPILLSDDIFQISMRKILFPSAQDMLPLAIKSWEHGHLLTVNEVKPVYLTRTKWNKSI